MILSGSSRIAGVIGWPVAHSRSPRLHGYWLEEYGIDGSYIPLPVAPGHLEMAVRGLSALGFVGANVTIPHKETVLGLMDHVDLLARRIGAVNTITVHADGTLEGSNTDGYGFIENLRAGHRGWNADRGPAVVLGAGGAARAVCAALLDGGAPEIRIVNRTVERAAQLAADVCRGLDDVAAAERRFCLYSWDEAAKSLEGASLLANTTSLGMEGKAPLDLALKTLPTDAVVTDAVYAPLETGLLQRAAGRGNPAVDGLGMLLHQARPGFAAWFGQEPEVTSALRGFILDDLLQGRSGSADSEGKG